MTCVTITQFFPKGLYQISSSLSPDCCLVQNGSLASKNDYDELQQWVVSPAQGGQQVYEIRNLVANEVLRLNTNTSTSQWTIDTQIGEFVIGIAGDPDERVVTLAANRTDSALWPISGRKEQRWIFTNITPGWMQTHNVIDKSRRYNIRNRATGRYWSYIGTGTDGYIVSDRNNHNENLCVTAYYQWSLSINPQDNGLIVATLHGSKPKGRMTMAAAMTGANSFYFLPVPGNQSWYFVASSLTNPPTVVTARDAEDTSKPASTVPLKLDDEYLMWQFLDVGAR
ncbi:hypothetical protein AMATHDRAFT_70465 [Amanita thiersii Skay4041]|uniref:Uncharacterized protein n=1 Tax=Amanita thiersii Skay4041 TaxID=703135 RepID=A0A2A9ND08_9AGAR|nr:hypothetical protein AMATHDRAFT_70465 [Amanita thiersii Skay4041]